jgi:transposase
LLGIDVSKDTLSCTLLDAASRSPQWHRSVPNTAAGIRQLLRATPGETPWVLEPTGRYSLAVVKQARQEGRRVLLAPPQKAQRFLQAIQTRAKTDRLDSAGLALYALSVPLSDYPLKPDAVEQLDQLLAARKGIAEAISRLKLQAAALPHAAAPLKKAVEELESQRKELERQIESATEKEETLSSLVAALLAVPGIGRVTATAAVSRLLAKQFRHPDQFVAFIGLDIAVRQSGRRQGERGLTKQGDAEMRRLFYLCAQSSVRAKGSPFRAQYEREQEKGLSKTAALNAVARKMARLCWSLVKHGSTYDPDRVYKQK